MNKRNYQKELEKIIEQLTQVDKQETYSVNRQVTQQGIRQETQQVARQENQSESKFAATGKPRLLLHSCCAPCSSYCMEYLRQYFDLTVFYYNPNITEDAEYRKRVEEEKRLIDAYNKYGIGLVKKASIAEDLITEKLVEKIPETKSVIAECDRIKIIEGDYDVENFYVMAKGLEKCPEGSERCFKCYELRLRATAKLAAEQKFDYFTTTLTISPLKNAEKLNEIGEKLAEEYGACWLPSDFKKKNGYKRSIELSKEYDLYRQNYCGCCYSKAEAMARENGNIV